MEIKSLVLGILFATGAFAAKGGVGLAYALERARGPVRRAPVALGFAAVYAALFAGALAAARRLDPAAHLARIQGLVASGMTVHLVLAAGLLAWGVRLLRRPAAAARPTRAHWLLVVPCPVCLTVVFLITAFLVTLLPDAAPRAVAGAYGLFVATAGATAAALLAGRRRSGAAPERTLGAAMVGIAGYFLAAVVVMPQFGDLEGVYRLASYTGKAAPVPPARAWGTWAVLAAAFLAGCARQAARLPRRAP